MNIGKADPFGLAGAFVPANQGENAAAGEASGGFVAESDDRSALNGIASPAHAFDALTQHDNNCAVVGGLGDRHDFRGGRVPCNGRGGGGFLFLLNFIFSAENGGHRITIRNNWIYRGEIFLNVTAEHLLYKGDHRKPEDRDRQKRARPAKGDTVEERPREVADRETFGNWEMDSIIGCKGSKAALVVLTERLTRYPVIFRVPDHTMESVVRGLDRIERRMGAGFRQVFRSITVDNGSEFQDCAGMERSKRARKPRTKIYYCHPYSAYERGSNENMNRIIRRFFPKGTSFDEVTAAEVAEVEEWMANYPRRILGWATPRMLFERYIT